MANRLANQSSEYLRKHSENPVDWWPWCEEAFDLARKEDKPVFISIGYFSCHWCSVMERESFEDLETANFLNLHFINIKVDRDDMPDIDKIYQRYYNTLTGESGGWPLSIYAFPDGLPFYIATYLPRNFTLRSRTFMSLNREITESWQNERNALFDISLGLSRNLKSSNLILLRTGKELTDTLIVNELNNLQDRMDWKNGGLDSSPKFPRFSSLNFLLKEGYRRSSANILNFVTLTIQKMAQGGIYDQINGGICRYSVDRYWEIPHFEKMLYDQAGWLDVLANVYAITANDYYKFLIEDQLHFLQNWMLSDSGMFFSSIDAETRGVEGAFHAFTDDEIRSILDRSYKGLHLNMKYFRLAIGTPSFLLNRDYKIAKLRYGLSKKGNYSDPQRHVVGGNILKIKHSINQIVKKIDIPISEVENALQRIRVKLREAQSRKPRPGVDHKIITSWNAMLITSLVNAFEKTGLESAGLLAKRALDKILETHVIGDHVYRIINKVDKSKIEGILDDYVFLIEALILAYEVYDDYNYILRAKNIQIELDELFYSKNDSIYYLNQEKAEDTIGRIILAMDDSFHSALSIQIKNLYKLGKYTEDKTLQDRGQEIVSRLVEAASVYKGSMNSFYHSAAYYLYYPDELVIFNDDKRFDKSIFPMYITERMIYRWPGNDNRPHWQVVKDRGEITEPSLFLCRGATCSLPITTIIDFKTVYSQ